MSRSPTTFQKGHSYLGKIGWTSQELEVLRSNYATTSPSELVELLPKRTPRAIRRMAHELELHKDGLVARHNHSIGMKKHYQEHPEAKALLRELGRRLLNSPYHHRRKPGEYTLPEESRRRIGKTLIRLYKENPEAKKIACRALEKGRLSMRLDKSPTEPERLVESLLESLGLEAIPQYRFNGFFLDFAFPEQRLAISVDGCYWHCCPIHFPMAETRAQQHNLAIGKRRDKILKKAGWRTFHIWEHEVHDPATLERLREEVMQAHENSAN